MFDREKALHLDTEQLDFIKQQIEFYPHELIGKTITISTMADNKLTATFRIASVSTHRWIENGEKELGWRVYVNLESSLIREYYDISNSLIQLFISGLSLYIRREKFHECELALIKKNVQENQIEVINGCIPGSYVII